MSWQHENLADSGNTGPVLDANVRRDAPPYPLHDVFHALKLQNQNFAAITHRVTPHVTRQAAKLSLRFAHVPGQTRFVCRERGQ
jgi:hypothetical protein